MLCWIIYLVKLMKFSIKFKSGQIKLQTFAMKFSHWIEIIRCSRNSTNIAERFKNLILEWQHCHYLIKYLPGFVIKYRRSKHILTLNSD